MMKMDTILQACMENVLNVLADQDDEDSGDPLAFLSPVQKSKLLRSKEVEEMLTDGCLDHRSRLEELGTEDRLASEVTVEKIRYYQLKETEQRLTDELRTIYESQAGLAPHPGGKRRRLNSEVDSDPPGVVQGADDSDADLDDYLEEHEQDLERCRQQLDIAKRQLEKERKKNKILEDMLLAIQNRTS